MKLSSLVLCRVKLGQFFEDIGVVIFVEDQRCSRRGQFGIFSSSYSSLTSTFLFYLYLFLSTLSLAIPTLYNFLPFRHLSSLGQTVVAFSISFRCVPRRYLFLVFNVFSGCSDLFSFSRGGFFLSFSILFASDRFQEKEYAYFLDLAAQLATHTASSTDVQKAMHLETAISIFLGCFKRC